MFFYRRASCVHTRGRIGLPTNEMNHFPKQTARLHMRGGAHAPTRCSGARACRSSPPANSSCSGFRAWSLSSAVLVEGHCPAPHPTSLPLLCCGIHTPPVAPGARAWSPSSVVWEVRCPSLRPASLPLPCCGGHSEVAPHLG